MLFHMKTISSLPVTFRYMAWSMMCGLLLLFFSACAGPESQSIEWYLRDKPREERIPVSGERDPADPRPPAL